MKKSVFVLIILIMSFMLSGCGQKKILTIGEDKYALTVLHEGDMVSEKYYIKDGARFYEPLEKEDNGTTLWLLNDMRQVPSMYSDGVIAYISKETTMGEQDLTRYRYIGYTLGVFGLEQDEDGYWKFSRKDNCVKNTSAYEKFYTSSSDNLRLATIDDKPITEDMVSESGILTGLEEGKEYQVAYFSGSKYRVATLKADYIALEAMGTLKTGKGNTTKNGYFAFSLPDETESGYYKIDGALFKYYNYEKGTQDDDKCDMNIVNTPQVEDSETADMQQYRITVQKKTYNALISVTYDAEKYTSDEMQVTLISPDGTEYQLTTTEEGVCTVDLAEMIAGSWKVNVRPKDAEVTIACDDSGNAADTNADSYDFVFDEDAQNMEFVVKYTGEGSIWGNVVYEGSEESENLVVDEKNKTLSISYAYLKAGKYTVTVYHYVDTAIEEVYYTNDDSDTQTDVIIIEN